MDKISLASYQIKLRTLKQSNIPFDNYDNQTTLFDKKIKKDFFTDLVNFLDENREFTDIQKKKNLEIQCVYPEDRFCYGRAYYGSFGKSWKSKNIKTGETDNMDVDTASEEPFYYLFYIPENSVRGIALFERKGSVFAKETFERFIDKELFKKNIKGFHLKYDGYLPKKVVFSYIDKGEITAFEFSEIPSHNKYKENRINRHFKKIHGKLKIRMQIDKSSRSAAKQWFYKLFNHEIPIDENENDLITLKEIDSKSSKVEVKINKIKRAFYIDGNSIRPFMDITEDIKYEEGHPDFGEIHKIAIDYAHDLMNEKR